MSTKIFVHHPLKRAELKRLGEPPRPHEPVIVEFKETPADPEEKARRAQERATLREAFRQEQIAENELIDSLQTAFGYVRIDSRDFCRAVTAKAGIDLKDPNLTKAKLQALEGVVFGEEASLLAAMLAPNPKTRCIHCREQAAKRAMEGTACFMVSLVDGMLDEEEVFSFLLCSRCAKLDHGVTSRSASVMLYRKIMKNDPEAGLYIKKSKVFPFDFEYLGTTLGDIIANAEVSKK